MSAALPFPFSSGFFRLPAALVVLMTALELAAWAGWLPPSAARPGTAGLAFTEMLLILLLLWNGLRIYQEINKKSTDTVARRIARLGFLSLALCSLGDLVNRNLSQNFYAYDHVIEHSYLADSVWFFFPGYLLFLYSAWLGTSRNGSNVKRTTPAFKTASLLLAAVAGIASFLGMVPDSASPYIKWMSGSYSVLITMMIPAGLWIYRSHGSKGLLIAAGAVMATAADALIGQFWLFGHDAFPGIAHLNMVVYFLSQALIQQWPLLVASQGTGDNLRTN